MDRLLVILVVASFALTAVAAISDHAVGAGPRQPAPAAQEADPTPSRSDPVATGSRATGAGYR